MTAAIKINANDGVTRNVMVGGETTVDFDFPIFDATHIELYETDTSGVITQLEKDTDFTVPAGSVNVQAGGTLNLDSSQYPSGATAGHVFTAYQAAPYSRTTDFNQAGDFFADTLNQELDLISQQIQQIRRDLARAPLAPVDTTLTSLSLADPIDEYILMWDGVTGSIGTVALSSISLAGFDTLFTSLANNDGLFYNSSQTRWENETPAETRTRLGLGDLATSTIVGETSATVATGDSFLFADANDSNAIKRDTIAGILSLAGGTLVNIQLLTSSSGTYTATSGATKGIAIAIGGGGGGGGADGTTLQGGAGAGGGGGEVCISIFTISGTVAYTVGAGGTAGSASGGNGGAGGTTTFTGVAVAAGGSGGTGSGSTGTTRDYDAGADGGTGGGTGTIQLAGGDGSSAMTHYSAGYHIGGVGGSSVFGGGGKNGIINVTGTGNVAVAGGDGNGYGGGGGGAAVHTDSNGAAGGAGAAGAIIVLEFK